MNDESLFHLALEKPAAERPAFLEQACSGDDALRQRVEALLQSHETPDSFLIKTAKNPEATTDSSSSQVADAEGLGATDGGSIVQISTVEGPGSGIGPYKLLQPLGEGGMGTVYMAEQTQPVRRTVALKLIKAGMDSRQVLARFGAERQALALMDHPNIAKVLDAGATDTGRPYFVMELVKGIPITRFCDERRLTLRERLELVIPVCQAVQHAHQKGIIHRDIKPSNVLVALYDPGAPGVPKVIDFGVAKATGPRLTDQTLYTEFGAVVGTLEYMSPEQAELNQLDIDTRSDIYSLGVLLYELLTGSTPLEHKRIKGAVLLELLRVIREEESPRPSLRLSTTEELPSIAACRHVEPRKLSGLVRGDLDWIVMRCLEKDRNRRYETASGLATDLRRYLDNEPVQACPPSARYRLGKFARRNRAALTTATLLSLALLAGTVISTWQAIRATRAEAVARAEASKVMAINQFLAHDLLVPFGLWWNEPSHPPTQPITLRVVLDRAAEKVGSRFQSQPLLEAATRTTLGDTYYSLKLYKECQRQSAAALEIYEREKGPWAAERAMAMVLLAGSMLQLNEHEGDLSRAESMTREALKILRHIRGADHRNTFSAMWVLADAYGKQGKFPDEAKTYAELLEAGRRVYGADAPETIAWMDDLARSYLNLGELSRAESLAVNALALSRRVLGQEHLQTISCLEIAELVYQAQGRLSEAERVFSDMVAIYQTQVAKAPGHPGPPNRLAWLLATCPLKEICDPKRAVELARKAVDLAPKSNIYRNTLGVALYRAGDWKAAIEALEESGRLAPDKYRASNGFFLAMAHWQLGDKTQSRFWYDKAVPWMEKNQLKNEELIRFRAEAAAVLGVKGEKD
jgi:serine/threonine protein kinase